VRKEFSAAQNIFSTEAIVSFQALHDEKYLIRRLQTPCAGFVVCAQGVSRSSEYFFDGSLGQFPGPA